MLEAGGAGPLGSRSYVVTFVLLFACLLAWAAAVPMYGAPDEPGHMVKAYAVVHGDRGTMNDAGQREYRVPPEYTDGYLCYAFDAKRPASCLDLSSSGPDHLQTTRAARYAPFFYVLVGWPSLLTRRVWGLYLMRGVAAAWVALLLSLAMHNILRLRNRGPLLVGGTLAMTPAVFFFGASVNPSGMAIAAGMAVWTGGFALLRSGAVPRQRLPLALTKFAAPLCLFLLLRRDSLLWAGLILISLAAITRRERRRELASSHSAWGWGAAVLASALLQLATGTHGATGLVGEAAGGGLSGPWHELPNYIREVGGGVLGWRDSPVPTFVYDVFSGGTVTLVTLSLFLAPRRIAVVVTGLVALVVTAPVAIGAFRYPYFQGRYLLPLAVGVALMAGLGLSESTRSKPWPRYLTLGTLALVAAAHVLAFGQTLRRYTAGAHGGWFFSRATAWQPPVLGATPLAVLYAASIVAVLTWMFVLASARRRPPEKFGDGRGCAPRAAAARRFRPLTVDL
jgi:hypothetical protein